VALGACNQAERANAKACGGYAFGFNAKEKKVTKDAKGFRGLLLSRVFGCKIYSHKNG
jgi:hypothetical protein